MKNFLFYLVAFLLVLYISSCKENVSEPTEQAQETSVIIPYTNDGHGWMDKSDQSNEAAVMMAAWCSKKGYSADGNYLILSGNIFIHLSI
jgi:hypothetical protein